jgi:Uma2 family endonuclease
VGFALAEHSGPWTIEDVEALPDNGDHDRYELLTPGVLTVSPAPGTAHQRASRNLANLLDTFVPPDLEVLEAVNVEIPGGRLCQPDIVVVDAAFADTEPVRYPPHTVRLIIEVVSPNSHPQDRLVKPQLCAEAGIQAYWRFELEKPRRIIVSELRRGRYVQAAVATPGVRTVVDHPFRVELDPGELVRRAGSAR